MYELMPYGRDRYSRRYNPFKAFEEMEKRFFSNPLTLFEKEESFPIKTDIRDMGEYYLLEADLPGFDKKDITLEISDNILTISACRNHEDKDDNNERFIRCERFCGCYTRQFELVGIDKDRTDAKYENGVLTVELYKKEEPKNTAKEISIK